MRKRAEQAWRMRWGAIVSCTSASPRLVLTATRLQRMRWSGTTDVLGWSRDFLFLSLLTGVTVFRGRRKKKKNFEGCDALERIAQSGETDLLPSQQGIMVLGTP